MAKASDWNTLKVERDLASFKLWFDHRLPYLYIYIYIKKKQFKTFSRYSDTQPVFDAINLKTLSENKKM